jgi:hypothetical protein
MEWLIVALGGGLVALLGRRLWGRRGERRTDAAELAQMKRVADEDVTLLGEELARLDGEVRGRALDQETRLDYQRALDAYESAQRTVPKLDGVERISMVTDTLATGRYAVVCVRARLAGREIPERRVPCFFNPQHGPSVADVVWTSPRRGTRTVPACAQDAARLKAGEQPEMRYVEYGGRRVPYWEAGGVWAPYGNGYFAAGAGAAFLLPSALDADMIGGVGGFDAGGYGGHDSGGADFGGFDGGGGGGDG